MAEFLVVVGKLPDVADCGLEAGDIITVKPDGWKWGDKECLPAFMVVKVPNLDEKQVKIYEEPLYTASIEPEKPPEVTKVRKYNIPLSFMKSEMDTGKSELITQKTVLDAALVAKTGK